VTDFGEIATRQESRTNGLIEAMQPGLGNLLYGLGWPSGSAVVALGLGGVSGPEKKHTYWCSA
jgi:hypothetical protein